MAILETEYLFVYGTLMKKYPRNPYQHAVESYASYLSEAVVSGNLYLVDDYPGLIDLNSLEFVYGELHKVQDPGKLFHVLDDYEGYDPATEMSSLFKRKKIKVYAAVNEKPLVAWAYVYNQPTGLLRKIESGNFMDFYLERPETERSDAS